MTRFTTELEAFIKNFNML